MTNAIKILPHYKSTITAFLTLGLLILLDGFLKSLNRNKNKVGGFEATYWMTGCNGNEVRNDLGGIFFCGTAANR